MTGTCGQTYASFVLLTYCSLPQCTVIPWLNTCCSSFTLEHQGHSVYVLILAYLSCIMFLQLILKLGKFLFQWLLGILWGVQLDGVARQFLLHDLHLLFEVVDLCRGNSLLAPDRATWKIGTISNWLSYYASLKSNYKHTTLVIYLH